MEDLLVNPDKRVHTAINFLTKKTKQKPKKKKTWPLVEQVARQAFFLHVVLYGTGKSLTFRMNNGGWWSKSARSPFNFIRHKARDYWSYICIQMHFIHPFEWPELLMLCFYLMKWTGVLPGIWRSTLVVWTVSLLRLSSQYFSKCYLGGLTMRFSSWTGKNKEP